MAAAANARGVPTRVAFFGRDIARALVAERLQADLLIGNNVLAQVPDLGDFVEGMRIVLRPGAVITMEFPHLQRLIEGNQFDTIYHEHFLYLSRSLCARYSSPTGCRCLTSRSCQRTEAH